MSEVLEKIDNEIVEFNEFDAQLAEFKGKYEGVVYDLTVPEDEKQARSDRLSIGKVIANLDRKHKDLKAPLKAKTDLIDGERKRIKDDLLEVQENIKSQIKQHEDAIQAHAEMLQGRVDAIVMFLDPTLTDGDAVYLAGQIATLKAIDVDDSYEHRKADATLAQIDTIKKLEAMLDARVKYEGEQAELEKLRAEAEEREQKDRDEAIRKEAESKAKDEHERIRLAAQERAENERKEAEAESARQVKDAEERGRKAVEDERARIEQEQKEAKAKQDAEQAKEDTKKSKQAHRNKIHKAAKQSLISNGIADAVATEIITLIKEGKIDHVTISY